VAEEVIPEDLISVSTIQENNKIRLPQLVLEKYTDLKPGIKYMITSVTFGNVQKIRLYKSISEVIYENKIPKDYNITLSEYVMKLLDVQAGDIIGFEYDGLGLLMRKATNQIKEG